MIDPLQEFSFRESNYERPNQDWECGWAAQGEPCHIGPDGSGICQAHHECVPYKDGDRYKCARPQNFGGKCELGPRPDGFCSQRVVECQPARTLRHRRKLFTFTIAALALGSCLMMLGGPWGGSLSSPGELTLQHHSKHQECAHCHTAANGSFAEWVGGIIESQPASNDSQQCLKCHDNLGSQPLMAHGMDSRHLKLMRHDSSDLGQAGEPPLVYSLLAAVARNPLDEKNGLACALCHHEHRGRAFDLTQMSNVQCQSCHSAKFHSFGNGHPEFTGFPYQRRTRLYFDHVTHYRVHFKSFGRVKPGAVLPAELRDYGDADHPSAQSCQACHQPDSSGKMMPIQGFEHSCAACHGAEIEDDALPGIQLLAIPPVPDKLLSASGPAIGQWPKLQGEEKAKSHVMSVPPLMQILLSADDSYRQARKALEGAKWDDLDQQQTVAVQRLAWSIKRLIHELATEGEAAGARRLRYLKPILAMDDDAALLQTLSASLFHDPTFVNALAMARDTFFPDLGREIEGLNENVLPSASAVTMDSAETVHTPSSGWYTNLADGTIRYRVTGHSDRFMRSVLDLAGRIPHLQDSPTTGDAGQPPPTEQVVRGALSEMFGVLGDPTASYRCLGCHTADKQDNGRLVINWVGRHISPDAQSFTKFSHAPHLTLLAKDHCGNCHSLQDDVNFAREDFVRYRELFTANTNPHSTLTSGFVPVSKEACAQCHTSRLAGDSCLKCHNYHIFE